MEIGSGAFQTFSRARRLTTLTSVFRPPSSVFRLTIPAATGA